MAAVASSSELSRIAFVLVVFWMVVVQLADEVQANRTNDNTGLQSLQVGRSAKLATLSSYRMFGGQRRKRTAAQVAEGPFAPSAAAASSSYSSFVDSPSVDLEKRARSSFRGDLGKRMLVLRDLLSPADPVQGDLSTAGIAWLPGKRIKVSSRFRGDLGKRAKSSFRGDLGKREELQTQDQDQEQDQPEAPQTAFIGGNSRQLSPFLLNERGYDSRFSSIDNTERNDDYDGSDSRSGDKTAAGASHRWRQSVPRWRSI